MRAIVPIALLAAASLSGCMLLDQIEALSDCGPLRTVERATTPTLPLSSADFFAGQDTLWFTWELPVYEACPREHAKATASLDRTAQASFGCNDFRVKNFEVEVTKEFVPYKMAPTGAVTSEDKLYVNMTYAQPDIGLAQAFGEDRPASYTVRVELGYPSSGDAEKDKDCVRGMIRGVYLTSTYHEFKAKE